MRDILSWGTSGKSTHLRASEIKVGLLLGPTWHILGATSALRETLQGQREQVEVQMVSLVPLRASLLGVEKLSHLARPQAPWGPEQTKPGHNGWTEAGECPVCAKGKHPWTLPPILLQLG